MKENIARLLVEQDTGLELYENYSGRGMYGRETFGVTGSREDYNDAILGAVSDIFQNEMDLHDIEQKVTSLLAHTFDTAMDNMGLNLIWY